MSDAFELCAPAYRWLWLLKSDFFSLEAQIASSNKHEFFPISQVNSTRIKMKPAVFSFRQN